MRVGGGERARVSTALLSNTCGDGGIQARAAYLAGTQVFAALAYADHGALFDYLTTQRTIESMNEKAVPGTDSEDRSERPIASSGGRRLQIDCRPRPHRRANR